MKKNISNTLILTVIMSIMLVACSDSNNQTEGEGNESQNTKIATGEASSTYNIVGQTLSNLYSDKFDVISRTQKTSSSIENMNLLKEEKAEMALVTSDVLSRAVEGVENFEGAAVENVEQMATLHPNYIQVVTTADTGIETLEDLEGQRVAVGKEDSGLEVSSRALLESHGLTYDDIEEDYLSYAPALDAIRAGQIDVAFLTSEVPSSPILEFAQSVDLKIVDIKKDRVEEIAKDKEYFKAMEIPAGTYGNDEPIETAAIMNTLVVRSDLSEDNVYEFSNQIFDNLDQVQNSHHGVSDINLESSQEDMIAPIHPGAERFYDEQ